MRTTKWRWLGLVVVGLLLLALAVSWLLNVSSQTKNANLKVLADGSTLELRALAFTNNYSYSHSSATRWQKFFSPLQHILPDRISRRLFFASSGGFGFGTSGDTNLFIITVNRSGGMGWSSSIGRLAVYDDQGNVYDSSWGANTLINNGETVHGWQVRAFPRRSKTLGLRFLNIGKDTKWHVASEFEIPNPGYGTYPQWEPAPLPITQTVEDWSATLKEFISGERIRAHRNIGGEERTLPRQTRMAFEFQQSGEIVTNWAVQKINLADATGNRWFPYLSSGLNWIEGGSAGFLGALWPGESAWKMQVEFVRTSGFSEAELWKIPIIAIPSAGVITNLNFSTEREGDIAQLIGIGAPQAEHPEPFKWIAKYWGQTDQDKILSLTAKLKRQNPNSRLKFVAAVDQNGNPATLINHNNEDYVDQAFMLKVADGAKDLRITFALQQSRTVEFLARPEFVPAITNSSSAPAE